MWEYIRAPHTFFQPPAGFSRLSSPRTSAASPPERRPTKPGSLIPRSYGLDFSLRQLVGQTALSEILFRKLHRSFQLCPTELCEESTGRSVLSLFPCSELDLLPQRQASQEESNGGLKTSTVAGVLRKIPGEKLAACGYLVRFRRAGQPVLPLAT